MNDVKNRRILIIDDNRAIHDDFRKVLGGCDELRKKTNAVEDSIFGRADTKVIGEPFQLDSAYQGREGMEQVRQACAADRPYALAFIDVRMPPGWDGIETTAQIWELDADIQVVICTAFSDYSWNSLTEKLGRSDRLLILKKPFDKVEVVQLAEALVHKWELLQQSRRKLKDLARAVAEGTRDLTAANQALRAEIAERKQIEAALRESQFHYQELVEAQGEGVICTDLDQRLCFANPAAAELLALPAAQLTGRRLLEFVAPKDRETLAKHVALCASGTKSCCELEFLTSEGRSRQVLVTATPRLDFDRRLCGTFAICRDVTAWKLAQHERQMMELQLRQVHKLEAIGQLAAGIAHEINTPIQYVGDNTRFIEDAWNSLSKVLRSHEEFLRAFDDNRATPQMAAATRQLLDASDLPYLSDQIPAALRAAQEGIERVTKIVRAMKEFSHPGGKDKTTADLNQAIETTVTVARNEWKYVAEMKLDLDPNLPAVPCFLGEFNQSILNLVINAAHAIGDVVKDKPGTKGTITIQTRRCGNHVEICVSDTGGGIPETAQPHIFEPFFTTKGVGKGSGQGLAIVYGCVVKRHGGTVAFGTKVGAGTTFILRLPISPPASGNGSATKA